MRKWTLAFFSFKISYGNHTQFCRGSLHISMEIATGDAKLIFRNWHQNILNFYLQVILFLRILEKIIFFEVLFDPQKTLLFVKNLILSLMQSILKPIISTSLIYFFLNIPTGIFWYFFEFLFSHLLKYQREKKFQKFKTKVLIIFVYIVKLYLHKMIFVFSKNVCCRYCVTFKITLVFSTQ